MNSSNSEERSDENDEQDSEQEMDDTREYSIETRNEYELLRGASQENDNDWSEVHRSKRKRANTGSIDENTFQRMSNDDKLGVIFQKLINIEQQQNQMKYVKKSIQDNETAVNNVRLTTVDIRKSYINSY